mmetsp:Transcript_4340/g.6499  ORF Transcript_4340/g.6499 Transcript_4340/m.6499 type:complete len:160 (-) Transcript_4340:107-586(-)|eukprot:scaffold14353_cov78-Skeletonema_dohrnii-CCMP3373.AAC.1
MMSSLTTLLLFVTVLTASAGNARLRNFQLKQEIDRMEERIDMLEEQLETGSATCISDDECSGLPQCADNGYGNECYCQLPMGVCDGDFLVESETGHCVKPHLGCNRSYRPVLGCDGQHYGNPSCAQAAAVNVLCDLRADPDCSIPVPADANEPTSPDME